VVGEILRVRRVVAAVDAGQVINPDGLVNQIEGGIVQAVSWTLKEQVLFDRARVLSRSWEAYPILRFDQTPEVEVTIVGRTEEPALGAGECAAGPTAAAVANALYNAMGVRVRDLPLTPDRIARAMA
jgi:CO/xanthine dehydrogenase Mo-binding subunit